MKTSLRHWIDARFPATAFFKKHLSHYFAPKNLDFWYYFGVFSLVVFVIQIVSGIWLTMFYTPSAEGAFDSIQTIMRDVPFGWLLRYMHTTGASLFFVVIYLHMYRSVIYGSYQKPRELLWLLGMVLYVLLLMEAFTGYVLPWGQMSYWGAQVITSFATAIPMIGEKLAMWIRGDFTVSGVLLHRFFSLHVIALPLLLIVMVFLHLVSLHHVGSSNPDGVDIKKVRDAEGHPKDGVPFHPYYSVKDLAGVIVFLIVFCVILFFMPEGGGYFIEPENYMPANPLQTPEHIMPVWYMTPFYAILRAVPNKFFGVLLMTAAVAILFVMPWLDRSPVRSLRYRGWPSQVGVCVFVLSFVVLGYLGMQKVSLLYTRLAQIFTVTYFAFFALMPWVTRWETTKPVPERLPDA